MKTWYALAPGSFTSPSYPAWVGRSALFDATVVIGDPTGGAISVFPSVVVVSSTASTPPVVFPDDTYQVSVSEVSAAQETASAADAASAAALANAQTTVPDLARQIPDFAAAVAADIATCTATTWASLPAGDQGAIMLRILNGFATVIDGLDALGALSLQYIPPKVPSHSAAMRCSLQLAVSPPSLVGADSAELSVSVALAAGAPFLLYPAEGTLGITTVLGASPTLHSRSSADLGMDVELVAGPASVGG